jgi:tetratricopeptide (TPR) repeat protein
VDRILAAAFLFAVGVGSALAAGYDDFSRGMDAINIGNADLAILSFTSALNAGDLAPAYVPDAYLGRARAYVRKKQCGEALADLDEAIKLKPDLFDAYVLRVDVDGCLQKPDAALADMTAGLAVKPNAALYIGRAFIYWQRDNFPQAIEDFDAAGKLQPTDQYPPLWSAAAGMRAGTFDATAFGTRVEDLGTRDWPGLLLKLYRNDTTPDVVIHDAARDEGDTFAKQKCQADFFIGEWQLWRKDDTGAKASFQAAIVDCPTRNFLFIAATRELKRLK